MPCPPARPSPRPCTRRHRRTPLPCRGLTLPRSRAAPPPAPPAATSQRLHGMCGSRAGAFLGGVCHVLAGICYDADPERVLQLRVIPTLSAAASARSEDASAAASAAARSATRRARARASSSSPQCASAAAARRLASSVSCAAASASARASPACALASCSASSCGGSKKFFMGVRHDRLYHGRQQQQHAVVCLTM